MFDTLELNEVNKQAAPKVMTFSEGYAEFMRAVDNYVVDLKKNPNIDLADMDTRFSTAVRLQWLQNKTVCLVGVGGIGNWVWQALVSMGIEKLILIDDDTVEIHNIGPQAHHLIHLGVPKVEAAKDIIKLYRGVSVRTIKLRIGGYTELLTVIGEAPDILITAVDNMDFRNAVAADIKNIIHAPQDNRNTAAQLPEFFIDLRMSLGDWTAYALPLRSIMAHPRKRDLFAHYESTAVFPSSSAVQEPCTARAISYTGMNIASYVGAILHWYANEGRPYFAGTLDGFVQDPLTNIANYVYANGNEKIQFYMHKTWSSRDWESITPTHAETMLKKRIVGMSAEIDEYEKVIEQYKTHITKLEGELELAVAGVKSSSKGKKPPLKKKEEATVQAEPEKISVVLHDLEPGRRFVVDDTLYETYEVHPSYVTAVDVNRGELDRIGIRILTEAVYAPGFEPGGTAVLENPERLIPAERRPQRPQPDVTSATLLERLGDIEAEEPIQREDLNERHPRNPRRTGHATIRAQAAPIIWPAVE